MSLYRTLLPVILAYAGLTLLVTWPVAGHLFTAAAGFEGRDSLQHVWFNWWVVEALLVLGQSPTQVDWLYYPHGAEHLLLLPMLFAPLLALPVTLVGGAMVAYNLLFLSSFILGGLLTYLLALALTRHRGASFVAGVIFIFFPNRMGHALAGHLLLIVTWHFPLYALALVYLWQRPSWRWGVVGGVALAALTLTQPIHLAYFALPFSIGYSGAALLTRRTVPFKHLAGMVGVATVLTLPMLGPLLEAAGQGQLEFVSGVGLEEHSTDLLAFILPSPYHPLWREAALPAQVLRSPREMEEGLAYVGLLPAGLAVWAVLVLRRRVYLWAGLTLLAMLFSLGPTLHILGENTGITMPYYGLMELPFLRWSRTPGRLNEITALALAVWVAFGLADLLARLAAPRLQLVATIAVTAVILVDYLVIFPFPLAGQIMPAFYDDLRLEELPGALLDMPVAGSRRASNYSMLYQTHHHRPIVGGYIQRELPGTEELAQFFDRLLSPSQTPVLPQTPSLSVRRQILQASGLSHIVARRWLMSDQAASKTFAFMPAILGEPTYIGDDLLAWRLPPVGSELPLPAYSLLLSEKGWEAADDGPWLRLKQEGALLFIYAAQAGPARLTLELPVQAPPLEQQLWVGEAGPFPTGAGHQKLPLQLPAGVTWLPFRLEQCQECRAEFSLIAVE